jgi:hypothetical protein
MARPTPELGTASGTATVSTFIEKQRTKLFSTVLLSLLKQLQVDCDDFSFHRKAEE